MIEDIRWTWRQTKPGQSELTSNDKDKLRSEHIVSYYHQSFTVVVVVAVAKKTKNSENTIPPIIITQITKNMVDVCSTRSFD